MPRKPRLYLPGILRTLVSAKTIVTRHGSGQMGYLIVRRLNAAYRERFGAVTDSIPVTRVAIRFGFNHLGACRI